MTKNITVGYDGSASSVEAVEWAATEAAALGASLHIVCCYSIPVAASAGYGWPATEAVGLLLDAAHETVASIEQTISAKHPEVDVSSTVSAGPPALELTDQLGEHDLIVVGAGKHDGAAAFWLGSTPRQLVRHSPCPVVVVRGAATAGRPNRVVVGIDGSEPSFRALDWAVDEADRHRVALVVVHAWSYPYADVMVGTARARDLMQVDAACVLDKAVERAVERCGSEVTGVLVEDSPVAAVLDTVNDGDLLVIGSRGHGALVSGLIGSTVNAILDRVAVPVVVVRNEVPKT